MRAVVITPSRPGVEIADRADPEPGPGQILIRVRAAGLNNADLLQVGGHYPAPAGSPPDIPGLELAGEVVARGAGAERFALGDRVMAVVGGGGQATLAVVHERAAMPVPDALSWTEAGGFPEVFTTAHDALFTQAGLGPGERVCIHAAAGGVGTAAVQLAAAIGARIVATVRNPELRADVERLGSGCGLGSRAGSASHVQAVEPVGFGALGPFDVVLELVGGPNLAADLEALATGGRIVVIGIGGGPTAEIDLRLLMAVRGRIQSSTLRSRPLEQKALAARLVEAHVLPLVDAGWIRVPVLATCPLEDAADAYARFARPGKLGKIVLTVDET